MKKFTKLITLLLAIVMVFAMATACGGEKIKGDEYVFEAEGIDFTGLTGAGYSNSYTETDMIFGPHSNYEENVLNSLSNGYFVGGFCGTTDNPVLTFNINSDADVSGCTMKIRASSEIGTIELTPAALAIMVNDTALDYSTITITGSNSGTYDQVFKDFTVSAKFDLAKGENTIKFVLGATDANNWGPHSMAAGPGIDCIKVYSSAKLSWNSLWEDNKEIAYLE